MASERGSGQWCRRDNANDMERSAKEGDSPVAVKALASMSRAGHVKSCLNIGGPPSKPKYSSVTDSVPVP